MPPEVVEALRARRVVQARDRLAAGEAWQENWSLVFTQVNGRPIDPSFDYRQWVAVLAASGLERRRLHDARHTAATMLLVSGVSTRAAMEFLGHSQIGQTVRYTHVAEELARETSDRLGRALFRAEDEGRAAGSGSGSNDDERQRTSAE